MPSSQLLFPMGVRALVLIPAYSSLLIIFAELGLVLSALAVVLFVFEFAEIALPALIFEVIAAYSFSF